MTDTLKVTKPKADRALKGKAAAMPVPAGSFTVEDLAKAAASDDRAMALKECNSTTSKRPEPGLSANTKRMKVTDEASGVTESRVVPMTADERGDKPGKAINPIPDEPVEVEETTTTKTKSSLGGSSKSE